MKKLLIIVLLFTYQANAMIEKEIDFIDLSGGKKFDSNLVKKIPLERLQEKINNDTGRTLIIGNNCDISYVGIVKYDLPVGYAVFAAKDIKKGKYLFSYGGDLIKNEDEKKYSDSKYKYDFLDAKNHGDLGTLCMHLFKKHELDALNLQIDPEQYQSIQFENISLKKAEDNIHFHTSTEIKKYSVIGLTYGQSHWYSQEISPILVTKDANLILDLELSNPQICFRDFLDKKNGTISYACEQIITGLKSNKNNKNLYVLCGNKSMNIAPRFFNLRSLDDLLLKSSFNNIFVFIKTRNFKSELDKALTASQKTILLPLSIYGVGPYSDCCWDGITFEEHDI